MTDYIGQEPEDAQELERPTTDQEMAGGAFGMGGIALSIAAGLMWGTPAFLVVFGIGCILIGAFMLRGTP